MKEKYPTTNDFPYPSDVENTCFRLNTKVFQNLLLLFMVFFGATEAFAQVNFTKPNLPITVCSGFPSAYNNLGNIVITETTNNNFSMGTAVTLIFSAPANFEFNPSAGSVAVAGGGNLSAASKEEHCHLMPMILFR